MMKTWADEAGITQRARGVDRDAGDGPPRCCARRFIAADALVCYDDLAPGPRAALDARFPHLAGVSPLYLCDGCAETIIRERVVTREGRARDFGLPDAVIEKARLHDNRFRPA